MDSLKKILLKIEQENEVQCEQILAEAKQKAKEIKDTAKAEAKKISAENLALKEKLKSRELLKATSSAELSAKREVLRAKVAALEDIVSKALRKLNTLPDDEYFDIILKLAQKYAEKGDGVLKLSKEDYQRMPKSFEKTLAEKLSSKGKITVTGDKKTKGGGFVLCYKETVINADFKALLDEVFDEVKDELNRIIF